MGINLPEWSECIYFRDIDEMANRMKAFRWNMLHRQLERGAFRGELLVAQFGGIQFARMIYDKAIRSSGESPSGTIAIALPFSPPEALYWHGYPLTTNHALLQKSPVGVDFLRRGNFPLGLVSIDKATVIEYARMVDRPHLEALVLDSTPLIQPEAKAMARLRKHLNNVFSLIQTQTQQTLSPGVGNEIRRQFIPLILDILDSARDTPPLQLSSRRCLIKQAETFLMENLDRPLSVLDLCKELYISERTLRYGFQEYFGIAPAAYLKMQRLNGVRRQLKSVRGQQVTVTDIALRWGFWHMGQFAKDYKSMFGESPSETLRPSGKAENVSLPKPNF